MQEQEKRCERRLGVFAPDAKNRETRSSRVAIDRGDPLALKLSQSDMLADVLARRDAAVFLDPRDVALDARRWRDRSRHLFLFPRANFGGVSSCCRRCLWRVATLVRQAQPRRDQRVVPCLVATHLQILSVSFGTFTILQPFWLERIDHLVQTFDGVAVTNQIAQQLAR